MAGDGIIIIGGGRHGRNVLELLRYEPAAQRVAGFLDDVKALGTKIDGVPVLGGLNMLEAQGFVSSHRWHVAIGDPDASFKISTQLAERGARFVNAVHPASVVSASATIGQGIYLAAFVRIMPGSCVEDWGLFEAGSIIGTETFVGAGCRMGPGARLLGGAKLGSRTFAGAGSVICNDVNVGDDCRIGANAVVRFDVPNSSNAYGVPAEITPRKH
jgi:sugar O-acyltransferase (sialic acid O-acetyltransferase NeuD family)